MVMPLLLSHVMQNILGEYLITPEQLSGRCALQQSCLDSQEAPVPLSDFLRRLKQEECLIFPGPPESYSIEDMLERWPQFFLGGDNPRMLWYGRAQIFAQRPLPVSPWYGVCAHPAEGSTECVWEKQQGMLRPERGESVPDAVLVVWAILLFSMVCKRELFADVYVRTSARASIAFSPLGIPLGESGPPVYVGTQQGKIILGFHRVNPGTFGGRHAPIGVARQLDVTRLADPN